MDILTAVPLIAVLLIAWGLLRAHHRVQADDAAITARLDKLARLREENQRRFAGAPPLDHRALTDAWRAADNAHTIDGTPWPPSPAPRTAPPRVGDHRRRSHLTAVR